jgi:dTDP-4-dehydrorhamnose reductase
MKVLVTGVQGQLGHDVCKQLAEAGIAHRGVDLAQFDLTDRAQTVRYITTYAPDVVVHCAAYTQVDRAEDERELCYAVNVLGTRHVAEACRELNAKMVYISTDYVFNGQGEAPFAVENAAEPVNYYGLTKYEGERAVQEMLTRFFIVRTSWVFGISGKNFVRTMLCLGRDRDTLSVVDDQIGSPTYTFDLARLLCEMIADDKYGVYHATNEGYCSWYEFACAIFAEAGLQVQVVPITTEQYPTRAARPKNSRLAKSSLDVQGFARLPAWRDALQRYVAALKDETDGA